MNAQAIAELANRAFAGATTTIAEVGALVQRLLAVDITVLSEITDDGRYVFRALEADVPLPLALDTAIPYASSLCARPHAGQSPATVPDVREAPALWTSWLQLKEGLGVDWDILGFMTVDVPLPGGRRFGTLCVHHTRTRVWTADEQAVLQILARLAGDEIARSQAAGALDDALSRLAAAERRRVDLVAELGHELRAPLQVIDGYAEAMLDGVLERDDEHVVLVRAEAARSLRLLDDLGLLTRLEVDEAAEPKDTVALDELLAETQARLAPLAEAAGVALRLDAGAVSVEAPRARLEQVLANLVRNSLRAVGPGPGEIVLFAHATPDGVAFGVEDDGPGIDGAELDRIFDRFYRGRAARDTGPGSGLGLTIARRIVERANGTLRAEPRDPRGTRIVASMPAARR